MANRELTQITLYKNTPFDDTYKHVVNFTSNDKAKEFLNTHTSIILPSCSYQRFDKAIRFSTATYNYEDLIAYNYLTFEQHGMTIYAFITEMSYINDGVVLIGFNIDVWNTYQRRIDGGTSMFIKRRSFKNLTVNDPFDYDIIQLPDGEIGSDSTSYRGLTSTSSAFKKIDNQNLDHVLKWLCITTIPNNIKEAQSTLYGSFSQMDTYVLPVDVSQGKIGVISDNNGTVLNPNSNGKDLYLLFQQLSQDKRFVGTGTLVQDISIRPSIGTVGVVTKTASGVLGYKLRDINQNQIKVYHAGDDNSKFELIRLDLVTRDNLKPDWMDIDVMDVVKQTLRNYIPNPNQKLTAMPFSKVQLTDGKVDITIDPAFITDLTKPVRLYRWGSPFPNSPVYYALSNYNGVQYGDFLSPINTGMVYIDSSDYSIPFATDSYTSFLQANRNQLQNSRTNAKIMLAQQLEGVRLSGINLATRQGSERQVVANNQALGVTNLKLQQSTEMANFKQRANWATAQAGINGLTGIVAGGMAGGLMGAGGGALKAGMGLGTTLMNNHIQGNILDRKQALENQQMANANATQSQNLATQQSAAREINDRNMAFNTKVATNNYEMTLRNQSAMLADMKNHSASLVSAGGSFNADYGQHVDGIWYVNVWTASIPVLQVADQYFKLFGNELDKLMVVGERGQRIFDTFTVDHTTWNYVRTQGADLHGNAPNPAINILNVMLDNGVTIWPEEKINDFSNRNQPLN